MISLFNSDAFFNFVTNYFYENKSIVEANKFQLSNIDFNNFVAFIEKNHSDFETKTEATFKNALEKAKSENKKHFIVICNIYNCIL